MQPTIKPDSGLFGVNEIFETVQGEATFTGTPAVFLRLQGCDVGCPWCDTKHTWVSDASERRSLTEIAFRKTGDGATWAETGLDSLLAVLWTYRSRHLVITGGEPALYDLRPLSSALADAGWQVQLETSGTETIRIDERAFVTVSPKLGMPGGKAVKMDALDRADEIKMPVGKQADVDLLLDLLNRADQFMADDHPRSIWLQPLSASPKATALCIEQATLHGFRVSVQTHKFIGVR